MNNSKNRQPDYYVQLAQVGRNGKEKITDVGAVWEGKDGYKTGETIAGRIILQPREQREALREMRAEKQQQAQTPQPDQDVQQKL